MKPLIVVSGTPGTGKTTVAKQVAQLLGYAYLDGSLIVKNAFSRAPLDEKRGVPIIDERAFAREALKIVRLDPEKAKKGYVLDSHLSHFLPKKYVKLCIITKCDLKTLQKRLTFRGYSAKKVRENMDSEIFDTSLVEAHDEGHKVVVVDTSKSVQKQLKTLQNEFI